MILLSVSAPYFSPLPPLPTRRCFHALVSRLTPHNKRRMHAVFIPVVCALLALVVYAAPLPLDTDSRLDEREPTRTGLLIPARQTVDDSATPWTGALVAFPDHHYARPARFERVVPTYHRICWSLLKRSTDVVTLTCYRIRFLWFVSIPYLFCLHVTLNVCVYRFDPLRHVGLTLPEPPTTGRSTS